MQSFTDSTYVTYLQAEETAQLGFFSLNFHPIINFAALTGSFQRGFSIDILSQRIKTFGADKRELQTCQALFPHWTE